MKISNIAVSTNSQKCDISALYEAGFCLTRWSKDKRTNNAGNKLWELCKNAGFLIANGRRDAGLGNFTCKNASVVDYLLATPNVLMGITRFDILPFCSLYSDDHCMLKSELKYAKCHCQTLQTAPITSRKIRNLVWITQDGKKTLYIYWLHR